MTNDPPKFMPMIFPNQTWFYSSLIYDELTGFSNIRMEHTKIWKIGILYAHGIIFISK